MAARIVADSGGVRGGSCFFGWVPSASLVGAGCGGDGPGSQAGGTGSSSGGPTSSGGSVSAGAEPGSDTVGLGYDVNPDFDDYGVGCFLLAGSEVVKLAER